jgi:DNA-binding NarL/FixJ family response regulator
VRIVLAEDSVLLREGLTRLLADSGFEVVASVGTADDLIGAVARELPDLVITDVRMPPSHTDEGMRAALRIRHHYPHVAVVVLSQYVEHYYAGELLAGDTAGVGYLLKDRIGDVDEFVASVRVVGDGGTVLDPDVVSQLFARGRERSPLAALTPRETEVLGLMAQGRTNTAIAKELVISEGAVEKHVSSIFAKIGLPPTDSDHRRVLAVLRFLQA